MKRRALIVSDDREVGDWLAWHVTRQWPNMLLEHSRVADAPPYLDRGRISRYRLVIARLGSGTAAEREAGIVLERILEFDARPDVVIIGDDPGALQVSRSAAPGAATRMPASHLSTSSLSATLAGIARRRRGQPAKRRDGAPEITGYVLREALAGTYGATVYRAFSEREGGEVALKICGLASNGEAAEQKLTLRQEYETMRRLGGEYVARAYDYGEENGLAYMALEYFPRGNIGSLFSTAGRNASRVGCLRRVAEALRAVHNAGFLHLDLKPSNVMIRADGAPALIDFGISKRTVAARYRETQAFSVGSPYFMSPEQMRGEALDVRSDIFSFGALWYRIFTGQVPFPGRTIEEIRLAHAEPVAPSMGDALGHYQPIIDKTLAGERGRRFSTAQELIDNIDYHFGSATGMHRIPYFAERRSYRQRSATGTRGPERRRSDSQERNPRHASP